MRHLIFIAFLFSCLYLSAQKDGLVVVDPSELINQADNAFSSGDLIKADSLYGKAMNKRLNKEYSARLAENYGSLLINTGQYDSAYSVFSYGILADSMNDRLWFLRGELSGKFLRKADLAAGDISKAIELNPNEPIYFESRALAFDAMKNYPAADKDYSKLIELSDSPKNYTSRAMFYLRRGKYEEALEDANRAIEKDELYTWSYLVKGQVYLKQENTEKACEAFLKAEEMGNNSPDLKGFLTNCMEEKVDQ